MTINTFLSWLVFPSVMNIVCISAFYLLVSCSCRVVSGIGGIHTYTRIP